MPNAPWLNSERGYSRGAQIFLQRRTANGFTGWISYAYGHAEIRDGDLGVSFPSDYDQRHTFNAYVSRRLRPTVNVSARFTYGSGMPLAGLLSRGNRRRDRVLPDDEPQRVARSPTISARICG